MKPTPILPTTDVEESPTLSTTRPPPLSDFAAAYSWGPDMARHDKTRSGQICSGRSSCLQSSPIKSDQVRQTSRLDRHPSQTRNHQKNQFGPDPAQRLSSNHSPSDPSSHDNSTLCQLLDEHAPATTRLLPDGPYTPWYTPEISQAKRKRRQAERRWRSTKLTVHRQIYQKGKRKVRKLIFSTKIKHYTMTDTDHGSQR